MDLKRSETTRGKMMLCPGLFISHKVLYVPGWRRRAAAKAGIALIRMDSEVQHSCDGRKRRGPQLTPNAKEFGK